MEVRGGRGGYTPLDEDMQEEELLDVETYVSRNQNTVTQFITTRTIMSLCMAEERRPGSRLANWWWEKEGLELEGICMEDWEAERDGGRGG